MEYMMLIAEFVKNVNDDEMIIDDDIMVVIIEIREKMNLYSVTVT